MTKPEGAVDDLAADVADEGGLGGAAVGVGGGGLSVIKAS